MDLEQLIAACAKRKPEAREKLYHLYKDSLFAVCLKYCRSFEEAEDHLHDTFIQIFEKIKTFKGKGSFEGWMKRIAIYRAIDKYKKQKTFELAEHQLTGFSDEEVSIDHENQSIPLTIIMKFIQELPDQYRLIFNLYELDDFSHKEIARVVGIKETTSKSNLFRAKQQLKRKILDYSASESLKKKQP